jgi:hypothetical protein
MLALPPFWSWRVARICEGYMLDDQENALRERINNMLARGLKTRTDPLPEDNLQFEIFLHR